MAWLWVSREEYERYVHPLIYKEYRNFNHVMEYPRALMWEIITNDSRLLDKYKLDIFKLLNKTTDVSFRNKVLIKEIKEMVLVLIGSGERLLFFHKRLALDSRSNTFMQDKDLIEHWDRYAQSDRIFDEVEQLRIAIDDLLNGYHTMAAEDGTFLISPMNLPDNIIKELYIARNLFSVGFDEVGVLIASRALEGLLRIVSEKKKIGIKMNNKIVPAFEADMHDIIEALYRIRWSSTKNRIINNETRNLLHYLRSIRNSSAHSSIGKTNKLINPREIALIVAGTAREIWNDSSMPRSRVDTKVIEKCW